MDRIYYLSNSFSINMLPHEHILVQFDKLDTEYVVKILSKGFVSAVGHADTAELFSNILGIEVVPNRQSITLSSNDVLIVGQYIGPRLPEGSKKMPKDATIEWWHVKLVK
jgi:hypothetical protein